MIKVTCIYIAGSLMAVDENRALPVVGSAIVDRGDSVYFRNVELDIRKFNPDQSLADFLIECDRVAAERVMQQEDF